MRKFLVLGIVASLVAFLIVPAVNAQPDELTIWVSAGPEYEWMNEVGDRYEDETGISINVESVEEPEQAERLALDGPAGDGPDIVGFPHDGLGATAEQGLVDPIENYIDIGYADDNFVEVSIDALTYDGKHYGLPYSYESLALVYNKDLIDEVPETFDELFDVAKGMTNQSADEYGFLFDIQNFYHAYGYLAGFGGYVFGTNPDGTYDVEDIGLDNAGAIEGAEFLARFREEGLIPQGTDGDVVEGLFIEEDVAMIVDGPWAISNYLSAGIDVGVAALPELPNGEYPNTFVGVKGFYISSFSNYSEDAADFIKWLTSAEISMDRYLALEQIVPHREVMASDELLANERIRGFSTQARRGHPMPNVPEMATVWDPAANGLEFILGGRATAQQAMPMVVQQIRQGVRQMR